MGLLFVGGTGEITQRVNMMSFSINIEYYQLEQRLLTHNLNYFAAKNSKNPIQTFFAAFLNR